MTSAPITRRLAPLAAIAGLAFLAIGARCIENTSVQKDAQGYSHIYGEMINETDIQGSQIVVHGKLIDAAGAPIAETDAMICPPDLQPHSQAVYDIRFPAPVAPAVASHEVRPASGKALEAPLTDPQIELGYSEAAGGDGAVIVAMGVFNRYEREHTRLRGCLAVYDLQGKVVFGGKVDVVSIDRLGDVHFNPSLRVNTPTLLAVAQFEGVPASAVTARGWIWIESTTPGTSTFQYLMTDQLAIESDFSFNE